tara:strand:+ start:111 stop:308 length:198 start_codon:yes stop_codon:yes gene_type:complete
MTLQSYINEIETQSKKPIEEQMNDLKIASAKLLQTIDNLLPVVDKVVEALEKETNNVEKQISDTK